MACKRGNLEIVQYFVKEMGVDINEPKDDINGRFTPLDLAIAKGYFEIA